MRYKLKLYIAIAILLAGKFSKAQDKRIFITTAVGANKIKGSLHNVFRSTVAFNSAIEIGFSSNWYAQGELNFNTLRYNQRKKDDNSSFLFKNTNSSLLLLGVNGGKNFNFGSSPWFTSVYLGSGFASIGEPRISVDVDNKIVEQTNVSRSGIFGKGGLRFGIRTKSKILQTLFVDGSYWVSSVTTQGGKLKGLSAFALQNALLQLRG
jgi:hypothetical protein